MPREEVTVDRIFAGNLDDLPPLSSKVTAVAPSVAANLNSILYLGHSNNTVLKVF